MAATSWGFWGLVLLGAVCLGTPKDATAAQGRGARMRTRLSLKFYNIEHCKDKEHSLHVNNVSIEMDRNGDYSWNIDFDLLSTANGIRMMNIILHRCHGGIAPNLCEYHKKWSWGAAVCQVMRMPGVMYSPIILNIRPDFACPLRKGHYTLNNSTVDVSSLDRAGVDIDKFIYLVEFQLNNERGELFLCFKFALEPRRVRAQGR